MTTIINNSIIQEKLVGTEAENTLINCKDGSVQGIESTGSSFIENNGACSGEVTLEGYSDFFNSGSVTGNISLSPFENKIYNTSYVKLISGTSGKDCITNLDTIAEGIYEESGDNVIINKGTTNKIYGGTGDNIIINEGIIEDIINGEDGEGNPIEINDGFINVGNGNNTIINIGSVPVIEVGSGNNVIDNYGNSVSIVLGAGNNEVKTRPTSIGATVTCAPSGVTTLHFTAPRNYVVLGQPTLSNLYRWEGNDIVITYNNYAGEAWVKNYNPENTGIIVYVDDVNLAELVPDRV